MIEGCSFGRKRSWGLVIQGAVRTPLVVVPPPLLGQHLRFEKCREELSVE